MSATKSNLARRKSFRSRLPITNCGWCSSRQLGDVRRNAPGFVLPGQAYSMAKELFCGGQILPRGVNFLMGYVECEHAPSVRVQHQSHPAVFLPDHAAAEK